MSENGYRFIFFTEFLKMYTNLEVFEFGNSTGYGISQKALYRGIEIHSVYLT